MYSILQIINIIISVVLVALIVNESKSKRFAKTLKFNVEHDNTPILTVKQDDIELNFILDTGSSVSAINTTTLNEIYAQKLNQEKQIIGIEGTLTDVSCYEIPFSYNNYEYNHTFVAKDFSAAFMPIEEVINKPIHGLIGSDFCDTNGFVIDFQTHTINAK